MKSSEKEVRKALAHLATCVSGTIFTFEDEVVDVVSQTNVSVLRHWWKNAEDALAASETTDLDRLVEKLNRWIELCTKRPGISNFPPVREDEIYWNARADAYANVKKHITEELGGDDES